MSVPCQGCGTVAPPGAKFCAQCGAPLAPRCPSCGTEHPPNARFCGNCGTQLAAAPAAATTVSAAIERRHMTFMFCDLVGSTELSQAIDAEDLREIVADYRDAASGAVSRHEGTVAQFYGDGILVYFGYPVAHEDDGRRAVQAAIEILDAVAKLSTRLRTERPVSLAVRIGVHTGVAIVGDVGGANRTERLAMGDTPNITARIQGLASPNAIVISAATHQLVRDYFTTRSLGPQMVKGVAGPIEAFEVVGPAGAAAKADRTAGRGLTAYVGRETVLEPLRDAWKSACAGQGRVVVVTGDAGVGKSRLIRVFREGLSTELLHCLECFCSPYHENSALHPMVEMFRARLRLAEENDPKLHLERLRALLVEHRLDAEGALPLAAQLLRIPPDTGYTPLALHPLTQKQRNLELLQSLILAPAERRPTLLLIEDAHWIDPTTLEMLGGLLERVSGQRILVVITARPTFRAPWQPGESLVTLAVRDLSPADTEAMVRHLTGGKRLPAQVLTMLVSKSDGNPLFVEEMTRMLLESGWLAERDDAFVLTGPMPEASVPTRLQDLLRARLDRLEPEARLVMQLASVVGRDFTYDLLAEVLPAEGQTIRRGLQQLLDAGLVFATGNGFTIKHELIKDAAYESLLRRTRQQYHERVATALEGTFADRGAGTAGAAGPALDARRPGDARGAVLAAGGPEGGGLVGGRRSGEPSPARTGVAQGSAGIDRTRSARARSAVHPRHRAHDPKGLGRARSRRRVLTRACAQRARGRQPVAVLGAVGPVGVLPREGRSASGAGVRRAHDGVCEEARRRRTGPRVRFLAGSQSLLHGQAGARAGAPRSRGGDLRDREAPSQLFPQLPGRGSHVALGGLDGALPAGRRGAGDGGLARRDQSRRIAAPSLQPGLRARLRGLAAFLPARSARRLSRARRTPWCCRRRRRSAGGCCGA